MTSLVILLLCLLLLVVVVVAVVVLLLLLLLVVVVVVLSAEDLAGSKATRTKNMRQTNNTNKQELAIHKIGQSKDN